MVRVVGTGTEVVRTERVSVIAAGVVKVVITAVAFRAETDGVDNERDAGGVDAADVADGLDDDGVDK